MRRLLLAAIALTLGSGIGVATTASAAPQHGSTQATCMHFNDPTVELVWSKVCHF